MRFELRSGNPIANVAVDPAVRTQLVAGAEEGNKQQPVFADLHPVFLVGLSNHLVCGCSKWPVVVIKLGISLAQDNDVLEDLHETDDEDGKVDEARHHCERGHASPNLSFQSLHDHIIQLVFLGRFFLFLHLSRHIINNF